MYIFPEQCNREKCYLMVYNAKIISWQQIFYKGWKYHENSRSLVDSLATEPGLKLQGAEKVRISKILPFIFLHGQHAWKIVYLVTDQKALSYIVHL